MTTWRTDFDALLEQLDALADAEGLAPLNDPTLADAARAAAWHQDIPGELGASQAASALVWRLAWLFFVRAPALDARHFVLAPMSLDLVSKGERSLADALADIEALEAAKERFDTHIPAALEADFVDDHLTTFRRLAQLDGDLLEASAEVLAARVEGAVATILEHEAAFRALYSDLTSRFVEEFDEIARSGAFRDVMHGHHHHEHAHRRDGAPLDTAAAYLSRAAERFEAGDLDGVIDDATAAIALDPKLTDALLHRGVAQAALEALEPAIDDFSAALDLHPDHVSALIHRGLAFYARDEMDAAIGDFDRAVELDPRAPEARANRGIVRFTLGDLDGALDDFDAAVELDPDSPAARSNRAMVHRASGDLRRAITDYEHALKIDPNYAQAHAALGYIFLEAGYPDKAVDSFGHAARLQPFDATHHYNRGNAHAALERFAEAIDDYTRALEVDSDDVESLLNRGLARLKQEDFRGAINDWNQAIAVDPYNPMPYAKRAGVWNLLDQPAEAAQDLVQALDLAPDDWEYADFAQQMLRDIAESLGYDPQKMN